MKTRFALLLFTLFSTVAFAQQQPYFETFEVRLHDLEVVVTDAQGKPVRGLTQDDFVLLEDGKPQAITNFSVFDRSSTKVSNSPSQQQSQPQADAMQGDQLPRRVVFFIDDMSLRRPVRMNLLKNAAALLDRLQPDDLVAVVRPIGTNRLLQPFTADRSAVRRALAEAMETSKVRFTALDDYLRGTDRSRSVADARFAQQLYAQRTSERVKQRLGELRSLVGSMAGIDGRKVVVVLTDGLPSVPGRIGVKQIDQMHLGVDHLITDWSGQLGDFNPLIDDLGRAAAVNGVTIYALEPQIPLGANRVGDSASSNASRVARTDAQKLWQPIVADETYGELMHLRAQTLRSLAEKTGGDWNRGVPMIDNLFDRVVSDLSSYYSLAYRATGETGRPRKVTVTVRNRPELHVRTRSEVIDRAPEREMGDLVASTLLYPRDVNELGMEVQTGTPKRGKSTMYVPLDVVIPLETLTFIPSGEGKYVATMDIHYSTSGYERDAMTSGRQRQTFEISEQQYSQRAGINYRFKSGVEVWPGRTRIAIGVMDFASHLVGFKTAEVDTQ